jgi:protein O-mannosyl-transferase
LPGVVLVLGCLGIYRDVVGFGFIGLDDDYNVIFNPHLGPLTLERVRWAFGDLEYSRRYQPLGWLGFAAVFGFSGLNPAGYHAVSIGLHAVNSLLVFAVLGQFARHVLGPEASRWRAVAVFAGAAFWAWHPLRVESVAWASGLLYQTTTTLLLASLWLHWSGDGLVARAGALLGYVLALLTYPVAVGFVPFFVVFDVWRHGWRRAAVRGAGYVLAAAGLLAVTMAARMTVVGVWPAAPDLTAFPLGQRVLQALYVWGHYLWRPWWPVGFTPVDPVLLDLGHPGWRVVAGATLFCGLAVVVWRYRRARAAPGWFFLAYALVLVPVLGTVEKPHFPSDRYAFLPQLVLAGAVVVLLARIQQRRHFAAWAAGVGLGFFALASRDQTEIWRDEPTLWRHIESRLTVNDSPVLAGARPALSLFRDGDTAGALARIEAALRARPGDSVLAGARQEILQQDAENRDRATSLGLATPPPPAAVLHHALAVRLAREGDATAAAHHLVAVHRLAPEYYERAISRVPSKPAR